MHLLVRETRTLDEEQQAVDLGHAPADLVFLSFADSDLSAAAVAWAALGQERPSLRLASLAALRHPMSVDLYAERVIARARCVIVRLLGGLEYWRYGAEELAALCRGRDIPLALLPGSGPDDTQLAGLSTMPAGSRATLDRYLRCGGPDNLGQALFLAARIAGIGDGASRPPMPPPVAGEYRLAVPTEGPLGQAMIVFYRSHVLAGDTAPVDALAGTLRSRGFGVRALYTASLNEPSAAALVTERLREWRPTIVLNATGFSARRGTAGSPLDGAGVPVLQLLLPGSPRESWESSPRGLSHTDLAMQVVLPELDGRLTGPAIAFKSEAGTVPGLDFAPRVFRPDPEGLALAADQTAGWARLALTPSAGRRITLMLSDYPGGRGRIGHAVGLDSLASVDVIARLLLEGGYTVPQPDRLAERLVHASPRPMLSLSEYRRLFAGLPRPLQGAVTAAWGDPSQDPSVEDGSFCLPHVVEGNLTVAVQPDRGSFLERKASYHDPHLPPRHSYLACYLWLRHHGGMHGIVHIGTHGTLEWLPGKAVALSASCCPSALLRGLPVIYPFIVNNPGEAAVAKRRLGAVALGHLTPPLRPAGAHGAAPELERLIDEYAAADGLDRRRTALLRRDILERAAACGLLAECGAPPEAPEDETLARLDAYLCDVKDLQIRDGLHVFGQVPEPASLAATVQALLASNPESSAPHWESLLANSAAAERTALLAALDGRFVEPGPAGAPSRGRSDVLPTGRNLFSVDPRCIPTRTALALAERAVDELLRRYLQDHGDWPRALVLNLWGSATMRTGGETLALALLLLGARPLWDAGSARVTGIEVLPLAELDRPRVDVTLRISGLFRDAFEAQVMLFDAAVRAVGARDEGTEWNPLAAAARGLTDSALRHATKRVFGPAHGCYGAGIVETLDRDAWRDRDELGETWLAASATGYGRDCDGLADADGLIARIAAADGLVHVQDHAETDLLDGTDHAAHVGGFAAAAARLGRRPTLYHLDTSHAAAPRLRLTVEEVRRIVRARATNPAWLAGMHRHGYRGAAEIARTVDALFGFAATLPDRLDGQFELMFDATFGDPAIDAFLRDANPAARIAMAARFQEAIRRGLWQPRRNAVSEILSGDAAR